jgi:integrase
VFLRFARDIEAVDAPLAEKVRSPEGGQQRSAEIDADRGTNIHEYLDRFQYTTMDHALDHLLWYGMLRVGGVHSIDLVDIDWEELQIRLRHRPAKGTTLKNRYDSEREIAIQPTTAGIVQDYVEHHRHDVTDEYDRRPLFTTEHRRPHRNTLRNRIYGATRPCQVGRECPHGEDPEECQAAQRRNWAPKCPSSESTHAIRRDRSVGICAGKQGNRSF